MSSDAGPIGDAATVLPRLGSAVPFSTSLDPGYAPGSLADQMNNAVLGPVAGLGRVFTYEPSFGLDQEFDAQPAGSSYFVTSLEPAVLLRRQSERLEAELSYAPIVRIYEDGRRQDGTTGTQVAENFNGHALVTVLPDTVFIDLRGYAAQQPRFGGVVSSQTTTLAQDELTQNYSVSAFPYVQHRFGGVGTAEAGYDLERNWQDSPGLGGRSAQSAALDALGNQDVTTTTAHAAFTTGENFGRYNGAALVSATDYHGEDVLQDAHRYVATLDNGYAITRRITALVRVGYENIAYSGTDPVRIRDAIWDVGVRLTPSENGSLTLRYGHHDGFNSLTARADLPLTARTSLFADYSAGLSTSIVDLQNALAGSDLDQLGDTVESGTGTPIYVTDDFAGIDAGLYRLHRLSAGARWFRGRDTVSASVNRDTRVLISSPFAGAVGAGVTGSFDDTDGTVSWSHDLTPEVNFVASFEYGVSNGLAGTGNDGNSLTASLSTTWQLSETVSATALYSHSTNGEPALLVVDDNRTRQDRVLFGLRKSF